MSLSVSKVGNVIKKITLNEYKIFKDSKRAARIAKTRYPDKTIPGTQIMVRKLLRDVGPEPVVGFLIGMYTNPVPGLGILGYVLGRGFAEGRKALTKVVKKYTKMIS